MSAKSGSNPLLTAPMILLLSLIIPTMGTADDRDSDKRRPGPLVQLMRGSELSGYRDSAPPNYQPDPFCTSGANGGAMGIHFVNVENFLAALGGANPEVDAPEVLIYEPLPGGRIRLVGAEYIASAEAAPVALEGHLLNYATSPNHYGVPIPYLQLHVWAWKRNANGTFSDWNPDVSCDAYDPNPHPQPQPQPDPA